MKLGKFKIKTGTIAIYVLALMLVTAGYWNYLSKEVETIQTVADTQNESKQNDENLGDAQLVSNNEIIEDGEEEPEEEHKEDETPVSTKTDDYFESSKLARDTMYSQTLATYKEMLNNPNVSEEQKAIVTQEISELNKEKSAIMICENLIATKGFSNCVIFVNTDSVSVVVEADELKTDEIAQIQNIISREMCTKVENIHIMTK